MKQTKQAPSAHRPTLGLAFSGSGNRTCFYIGFLEVLDRAGIKIDYLTASSGGSLVAAAYACGTLEALKKRFFHLNREELKKLIVKSKKGGLFSLAGVEAELQKFTLGKTFQEVRLQMTFAAVDIEKGEEVGICMGDIARAACVSCALPGIFEPIKWGNKILVDGGLLFQVPLSYLRAYRPDIVIGLDMGGTNHIFTATALDIRKILNIVKKVFFVDTIKSYFFGLFQDDAEFDSDELPNAYNVLGRSLDLAIAANGREENYDCDLLIEPEVPKINDFSNIAASSAHYYESGLVAGRQYLPKIKELIAKKIEEKEKQVIAV